MTILIACRGVLRRHFSASLHVQILPSYRTRTEHTSDHAHVVLLQQGGLDDLQALIFNARHTSDRFLQWSWFLQCSAHLRSLTLSTSSQQLPEQALHQQDSSYWQSNSKSWLACTFRATLTCLSCLWQTFHLHLHDHLIERKQLWDQCWPRQCPTVQHSTFAHDQAYDRLQQQHLVPSHLQCLTVTSCSLTPTDLEVNYIQDVKTKWSLNIVTAGCCVNTILA